MNFAPRQKAGDGLHVATSQPSARSKQVARLPKPRIYLGAVLVRICVQTPHEPILADAGPASSIGSAFKAWPWAAFIILRGSHSMPIYEYICKECHHEFEALVYGKEKAQCPKCHASKLEPQLSVFAVSAKGSSSSAPSSQCLRVVWRSTRSRRMLDARHELG